MLGCSMSRFSRGLVSRITGPLPPAVKQGGGVINQPSSRPHSSSMCKNPRSSESVSAAESREEQEEQRTGQSGASLFSEQTFINSSSHALEQASARGSHNGDQYLHSSIRIFKKKKKHAKTLHRGMGFVKYPFKKMRTNQVNSR